MALVGRDACPGWVPVRIVGALRRTLAAGRASLLGTAGLVGARVRVRAGGFEVLGREIQGLRAWTGGRRLRRGLL